jgi:hypothetical protein
VPWSLDKQHLFYKLQIYLLTYTSMKIMRFFTALVSSLTFLWFTY